ncbi:hypothetical protein PACID_34030 [Acidipropionibacterium acidipropionici ATCC 4875]|uniref:Uncharacterized protein n=1 Tax=Acidipropionibacterium acidipropionici (strain ATCC 4875 / DSM 20272 / JCM 6432 / NBRC 12425 / NCIMB 8070 / 4) TaxID=1171373 RepID=K7RSU5_ACIA4|nr:hypothetical protein PACID_34030 [Acidipropionibacterium acidipropionici ATCC 4875]
MATPHTATPGMRLIQIRPQPPGCHRRWRPRGRSGAQEGAGRVDC